MSWSSITLQDALNLLASPRTVSELSFAMHRQQAAAVLALTHIISRLTFESEQQRDDSAASGAPGEFMR